MTIRKMMIMMRMVFMIILIIEIMIMMIIRKGRDRLSEMGDFLYKVPLTALVTLFLIKSLFRKDNILNVP